MPVFASVFPITTSNAKTVFTYDVKIEIMGRNGPCELNKDKADPRDRKNCCAFLKLAFEKSDIAKDLGIVYDGQATLYTDKDFLEKEIPLEHDELTPALKAAVKNNIVVRITPTLTHHELKINKPLETMTPGELSETRRFLSLALCQDATNRGILLHINQGQLLVADDKAATPLRNGVELRTCVNKGIRYVQDGKGLQAAVELNCSVSAFYKSGSLYKLKNEFQNIEAANLMLRGTKLAPFHDPHRTLKFKAFIAETPKTSVFSGAGGTTTVLDYFRTKNIKVDPNTPLVSVQQQTAGKFPADTVFITPYQKVRIERMKDLTDFLHEKNAVKPHERYQSISVILASLNFTDKNPILKAFGLQVANTMTECNLTNIWRPTVQNGKGSTTPNDTGSFQGPMKYITPGTVTKWAVLYADKGVEREIINDFIKMAQGSMRNMGVDLPAPIMVQPIDVNDFIEKAFKKIAQIDATYILFVDPKRMYPDSHSMFKLVENRYKKVTQQCDYWIIQNVVKKNQRKTLENILNKMNLKIGGCNYAPKFEEEAAELALDKGTFVIGYKTAHPRMTTERVFTEGMVAIKEPSVMGFTGNYSKNPNLFVGNWLYQSTEVEHESIDATLLKNQMHHVLTLLGKMRPNNARPNKIVVLRDGISDHQYNEFIGTELQALKAACQMIHPDYKPKFILLVTTKDHNTRIFNSKNGGEIANPIPGTLIDYGVVRRNSEFMIIPQNAIKGTAQPVLVNILKNEPGTAIKAIQKFVHALSYSHQLTCSPTGLPEPIYQADILAKRGISSLAALKTHQPTAVPRQADQQYDVAALNTRLSMRGHPLELIRFTA